MFDEVSVDGEDGFDDLYEQNPQQLIAERGEFVYELFSIMIHSGSAAGGHYYAYIK